MSHIYQSLTQLIKQIEKKATPENMGILYDKLETFYKNESKLNNNLTEVCKLISLVGTYLVKGEAFNTTESQLIFDTFCAKNFMTLFLNLSSLDIYEINLEIIKTFSFLMINIKSTTYLYYFFSKNLLNDIINKDYTKYDEEFLSYYINFIKSLSLRLDEVSVQLFYNEKINNFPIVENVLKLYNHKDSMIRNVVRNIVLNILKINSKNIENHFTELPSISYLANVACHLRDICIKINNDIEIKKINNLQYLYDDLIDEATYIDDLLNLNLTKINYIIINCIFYYFILPVVCGALSEISNKISKKMALFIIIFFFINMKNEAFKNCLFALLFLDQLSQDFDYLLTYPQEKSNYSFYPETNKEVSFFQFISENYSIKLLLTLIQKNNSIYNKYKDKYPQLYSIQQKCEGIYQNMKTSKDEETFFFDNKDNIEMVINSFFNEDESNSMSQYHLNMSMCTGLGVGQYSKEKNTGEIYNICFLCYIDPIFRDIIGDKKEENSGYLNYKKNIIKEGLEKLIEDMNEKDEEMILLINLLFFVVQHNEVNICNNLLRHVGLENIREKRIIKESIQEVFQILEEKKPEKNILRNSLLSELSLNNNNFNYNNIFFKITKDAKNKLFNTIKLPLNLSNYLFIKPNSNNIIKDYPFLLPFTYKLIILNILNLSFDKNNKFQLIKEENDFDLIINNVENIYRQVLEIINSSLNQKQNEIYKEIGYNIFYKKWKSYNQIFNSKHTLELIKDEIMNSTFILLPCEYEKNENENYFNEISRKEVNMKKNIFANNILLFMIIHDIREILLMNKGFSNNLNSLNLIKDRFPLDNNNDEPDLNKNENYYDLKKIKITKNIKRCSISYKLDEKDEFKKGELIIINKYLYFAESLGESKVKIKYCYKITSITLYKDNNNANNENNKNIINFMIREQDYEDLLNKERDTNKIKEKDKIIFVNFEDEKVKDEISEYINDKIPSVNNDERMAFMGYIDRINNNINNDEEDF
jgi:hypothetical protein